MSWRIVVISSRAKLDLKLNYMVVRGECIQKIFLSEISTVIIETTAVSITSALMCELSKRKIKLIFCDEKRNPYGELASFYGSHDTSQKVKRQNEWKKHTKDLVWTEIVREKISNQKKLLLELGCMEANVLDKYLKELMLCDETNREGHSAKVYFNAIFGLSFTRSCENIINSALNYGYSILLSTFNREIVSNGYITQIGMFHDNMYNKFNLSCDLMEPFRILVDKEVLTMDFEDFGKEEKMKIVNILNKQVIIDDKIHYVNNAIKIYCRSIFDALNDNDISKIRFYRNEL